MKPLVLNKEEQIKIYWDRRKNCEQGKHKLKDNNFGITWCVTCGYLSNKPAPEGVIKNQNRLQKEDQRIWPYKIL